MLTFREISQLSDRDLQVELSRVRDLLFRQKIGVRTKHFKDSHTIDLLKKLIARLLTAVNARVRSGVKIEESASAITAKLATVKAKLTESQDKPNKSAAKKSAANKTDHSEIETAGLKVKKVEKKGLLERLTSSEEKSE